MNKSDVCKHYNGPKNTAQALVVSPAAITQWPEKVGELRQFQLLVLSQGKLTLSDDVQRKFSISPTGQPENVNQAA